MSETTFRDGTPIAFERTTIGVPTLVASGAESPDFVREASLAVADAIPGADHRTLAGQVVGPGAARRARPIVEEFLLGSGGRRSGAEQRSARG